MPDVRFSGTWGYLHRATDDGRVLTGWPPGMPRGEAEIPVMVPDPVTGLLTCEGLTEVVYPGMRNVLRAHGTVYLPPELADAVVDKDGALYLQADLDVLRQQQGPAEFAFGARTEITDWRLKGLVLGCEPAWSRMPPTHFWKG